MKRILIAGANPYNANKGVAALAISSIVIIHDILSKQQGEFEICVYNHEFKKEKDSLRTPNGEIIHFRNIHPTDLFSISCFSPSTLVIVSFSSLIVLIMFSASSLLFQKSFFSVSFSNSFIFSFLLVMSK